MPELLSYNDAVVITKQLIDYYNSPDSDQVLLFMADRFNLRIKPDFTVHVNSIHKNCPECSGCKCGECILGCYETHVRGQPGDLCYWDQALEYKLGTKLIVHEMAHVIYDQVYENSLSEKDAFDQSEQFAMYMENHFDVNMQYMAHTSAISISPRLQSITDAIIIGVAISAASLVIAHVVAKRISRPR